MAVIDVRLLLRAQTDGATVILGDEERRISPNRQIVFGEAHSLRLGDLELLLAVIAASSQSRRTAPYRKSIQPLPFFAPSALSSRTDGFRFKLLHPGYRVALQIGRRTSYHFRQLSESAEGRIARRTKQTSDRRRAALGVIVIDAQRLVR
jgi:hypothetical protein